MIPPSTFDPWEFVAWIRDHETELYVQVINPSTQQLELAPLNTLNSRTWAFWAQRLFMDPRASVRSLEDWELANPDVQL